MSVFLSATWTRRVRVSPLMMVLLLLFAGCSRNAQQLLKSGQKYISEGKYKEASIELRNAVQTDPQLAEAHYQLAITYAALAQLGASSSELTKAVALQPKHADALLMLGNELL